jgi:hypothetical protein
MFGIGPIRFLLDLDGFWVGILGRQLGVELGEEPVGGVLARAPRCPTPRNGVDDRQPA